MLSGCATQSWRNSMVMSPQAKEYLQQAAQSQGATKQQYQLLAVNQMLAERDLHDSQQLLNQINQSPLDKKNISQKKIAQAKFALLQNHPKAALKKLHQIKNPMNLPYEVAATYYATAAEAHLRNNDLAYNTIALISLNSLLDDPKLQQQNQIVIWRNLQNLPLDKLKVLLKRCNTKLLRGWIQLAIIAEQDANNPAMLYKNIESWQQQYQQHSANSVLPNENNLKSLTQTNIPTQIALLLPLHGRFVDMGKAVRDGFMAAYYANIKMLLRPPKIKVYDTSGYDVVALYQQAIQDGAQLIVGPLTKENVTKLANINLNVPVLALNYLVDHNVMVNNLVQFGLSPEQAVRQAADAMWQHGLKNLLIIVPYGAWGDNLQQIFMQKWQQLGGEEVAAINFPADKNIANEIMASLNIDQSKQRAQQLQTIFNEPIKFVPRRRHDLDGIFLVATPAQARQIRPLLRFYYAGDLPIFSIANIYAGYNSAQSDRDLNNIYFDDMPWVLRKTAYINNLKQQVQTAWPNNLRANARLYGLGIDAFSLSLLLPRLTMLPNFALNGVTGQLYLSSKMQIYRQLSWAHFVAGIPRV